MSQFWHSGKGAIISLTQTPIWSQACGNGLRSAFRAGQPMTSILFCARKAAVSCAVWVWHCCGHTQSFVQPHPSPNEVYYRREAWSSIGSWRVHPTPPVHSSYHGGWHPIPWLKGMVTAEGALSPVPEVSPSMCSYPHTAVIPVIPSQFAISGGTPRPIASSQKPVYNTLNWQHSPKSADHLHVQTNNRDETIVSDLSDHLSSRAVVRLLWSPLLCWCKRIVGTHLTILSLLFENSLQLTILQYAPALAVANYAAWCPQRMMENANWFS